MPPGGSEGSHEHRAHQRILRAGQDYSSGAPDGNSDLGINVPDLWPNMPMLDALRSYYAYAGDSNALTLMRNYCYVADKLPATDFGAGYWPMMRMGDNIDSVYWSV